MEYIYTLQNYTVDALLNINIEQSDKVVSPKKNQNPEKVDLKHISNNDYNPKCIYFKTTNKLLWCFLTLLHNSNYFKQNKLHTFSIEQEYKESQNKLIESNKELLKTNKLKKNEVSQSLICDKHISLSTFVALCVINQITTYIIFPEYYAILSDIDENVSPNLVICNGNNNYFCMIKASAQDISNYTSNKCVVSNILKPLKAISNYKVQELKNMCAVFKINLIDVDGKSKNKTQLYEELANIFIKN